LQTGLARHFDNSARILQTIPTDVRNSAYSYRNQDDMQASDLMFDAPDALTASLGKPQASWATRTAVIGSAKVVERAGSL
jgi:hypothetical protein